MKEVSESTCPERLKSTRPVMLSADHRRISATVVNALDEPAAAAAGSAHRRIAADQNNRIMTVFYQNIPFLSHLFAIQFMVYGVIAFFYVK